MSYFDNLIPVISILIITAAFLLFSLTVQSVYFNTIYTGIGRMNLHSAISIAASIAQKEKFS
ncbi:hypothetical protein CRI85_05430 [Leuconostoc pseudomesenteroides]|nr:hypothetical protein [Leuconostoc pseudomesenteroides]